MRTLYFEHESNRAIREGNWKLVALKYQPWELYDMTTVRTEGIGPAAGRRTKRLPALKAQPRTLGKGAR